MITTSEPVTLLAPPPESRVVEDDVLQYLSASRLKTWSNCRLQFFFKYVEKLPTPGKPALLVGKVAHSVLQAWNMARWRGEETSAKRMKQVFDAQWVEGCQKEEIIWEDSDQESKIQTNAWTMLEHYLEHSPIPQKEKPEAVEVRVERDLEAHGLPPLLGFIDLVREGGVIVDFKTTAQTPNPAQVAHLNEVQLGCYALLYREATGHTEGGFEIHSLVKTKQPKLVVTALSPLEPDQVNRLVRIMESYVTGVESEDFVPSPGLHCSYCDYFNECRAWKGGAS